MKALLPPSFSCPAGAFVLAAALSLFVGGNRVVGADILTPSGSFDPAFSFSETHSEKVVEYSDPDDPTLKWAEVGSVDATTLSLSANISAAAIGADTRFSLDLGDLSVQFTLGEDPNYAPGKTSVFIPTHGWDAKNLPIGAEGLTLSWAGGMLKITLVNSASSNEDAGPFFPAFSQQFIGETNSSIRKLGTISVAFGDLRGDATVYLDGTAATTAQHYANADYSDDLDVSQAKLSGSLDMTAPAVVVTGPKSAAPDENGIITVTGTATDGHGIAALQVSTTPSDPESWQDANIDSVVPPLPANDEWSAETARWSFGLEEPGVGTTQLCVRAVDLSGNVSPLVAFTVVRDLPPALTGRWDSLVTKNGDNASPIGRLTFQCTGTGKISGRLTMREQGRTYPFTGLWSGDTVRALIARPGLPALVLEATGPSIDVSTPQDAWLDGSLTEASASVTTLAAGRAGARIRALMQLDSPVDPVVVGVIGAFRSPYSATNPLPAELVGRYNAGVATPEIVGAPLGSSILSLISRPAGTALLIGRLADGTPLTWAGKVGANGMVPAYAEIYSQNGFAADVGALKNGTPKKGISKRAIVKNSAPQRGLFSALLYIDGWSVCSDTGVWVRPAGTFGGQFPDGFVADSLSIQGQVYTPPAAPDRVLGVSDSPLNSTISIYGNGTEDGINVPFTIDALNHASFDAPNAEGLSVSINADTGSVSGMFIIPGTTTVAKFNGLVAGDQVVGHYIAAPASESTTKRYGSVSIFGDQPTDNGGDWSDDGSDCYEDSGNYSDEIVCVGDASN